MLIFLVGYMACGKSTIGRKLHKSLQWPLYDTDKEIAATAEMSVAEIFDTYGEEHFRKLESDKIKELINSEITAIISTGGGAPIWGDNMKMMNQSGLTIYISRSAENIASRLSDHGREKRPKLRGLSDEELLDFLRKGINERNSRYMEAQIVINADSYTDDNIVNAILGKVESANK